MFKFDFSLNKQGKEEADNKENLNTSKSWIESKKVEPHCLNIPQNFKEKLEISTIKCGDLEIKHLTSLNSLIKLLKEENLSVPDKILFAEENHSDLITATYEGGLKIWECTYDLLNYLSGIEIQFSKKKVLDLGCGAGLIGIFCHLKGATTYFQDYNEEVLKYITIPNVKYNSENERDCEFYSGDWKSFTEIINLSNEKDKFDYIFTSETIYNVENYEKLHDVFEKCLKKSGTIFLAAKSHYFGVGGTLTQFEDLLSSKKTFSFRKCCELSQGLKRAILEIKFL